MSKSQLDLFATMLSERYKRHEISADEYSAAMEDIALVRGR